jgi:signal transduction histidine kinase
VIFCALGLVVVLLAASVRAAGGDHTPLLHHFYLIPVLGAALLRGTIGGALTGLGAGLVQAFDVFPLIERAGASWAALDALVSLATPLIVGLIVGRLVDRARDRGARLDALLSIQRSLATPEALRDRLGRVAELTRGALGVDRVRLVLETGGDAPVAASAPEDFQPAPAVPRASASPCRRIVIPLDAGQGSAGVLILERDGDLSPAIRDIAGALALHLALAIENACLTERQRHFAHDLEEKIAAATRRLRELDQAKNEFLSIASHELRTPLTALQGFSELLLAREVPPDRARRYLGHLHTESQRLGRIVADLLDLSRIESGRVLPLERQAVDLRAVIEANVEIFASQHPRHHFDWNGAGSDLTLCADRDAVDRMLKNLLSNAVKYSPRGGRVKLGAGPAADRPGMVELSVEDDGVGIAAEALPRIFDPYVRIANPETATAPGLGLGLSLVRGLAHAHGGSIEVESLPGKGSRFRLLLPT